MFTYFEMLTVAEESFRDENSHEKTDPTIHQEEFPGIYLPKGKFSRETFWGEIS